MINFFMLAKNATECLTLISFFKFPFLTIPFTPPPQPVGRRSRLQYSPKKYNVSPLSFSLRLFHSVVVSSRVSSSRGLVYAWSSPFLPPKPVSFAKYSVYAIILPPAAGCLV